MKNLKKYLQVEKEIIYFDEELDRKKNLIDEITFKIKGNIIRMQRNPNLSYYEQIEKFKNHYRLSQDSIKKKNEKLKFQTKIVKTEAKVNKNNIIDFFRD